MLCLREASGLMFRNAQARLEGPPMWLPSHFKSKTFRKRAEECRTLADSFRDAITRDKMMQLADDYERMADTAQHLEGSAPIREISSPPGSSRLH